MEYGYAKRGRGYGRVEIKDRPKLPKTEAVRWRFIITTLQGDNTYSEWFTTDASRVLATKPLTVSEQFKLGRQTQLALQFTREFLGSRVWQWQARRKS